MQVQLNIVGTKYCRVDVISVVTAKPFKLGLYLSPGSSGHLFPFRAGRSWVELFLGVIDLTVTPSAAPMPTAARLGIVSICIIEGFTEFTRFVRYAASGDCNEYLLSKYLILNSNAVSVCT